VIGINLSGVVKRFSTRGTMQLTTRTTSKYKGTALPPVETTSTITGMLQRCKAQDAKFLPQGIRVEESAWVFTTTALTATQAPAGRDGSMRLADRISFGGELFDVRMVWDRTDDGRYYKALVVKVGA
jgi:hypothetical protein